MEAKGENLVIAQKVQARQPNQTILHLMCRIEACSTQSFQDDYEEV